MKDISRLTRSRLVQATLMTLVSTKVIHGDPRQQSTQELEYVTDYDHSTIARHLEKIMRKEENNCNMDGRIFDQRSPTFLQTCGSQPVGMQVGSDQ